MYFLNDSGHVHELTLKLLSPASLSSFFSRSQSLGATGLPSDMATPHSNRVDPMKACSCTPPQLSDVFYCNQHLIKYDCAFSKKEFNELLQTGHLKSIYLEIT